MPDTISETIKSAHPLTRAEALYLLTETDLLTLGRQADNIRRRLHPEKIVTFVVDRNVNYTNVCESKCRFCAFYRDHGAADAYLLAEEDIYHKIEELAATEELEELDTQSAGINRHEVENERVSQERSSEPS